MVPRRAVLVAAPDEALPPRTAPARASPALSGTGGAVQERQSNDKSPRARLRALSLVFPAIAATAALVCAAPRRAAAQDQPDIVVTAAREPQSLDQVLWSSDVLTRPEIESSQTLSFQDLLTELPGVEMDNTGGLGKQSSLFMRGMNSEQTLLIVNGIRSARPPMGCRRSS